MSGVEAVDIIAEAIGDHDYSITNIGRCVCGVKTKDMPAHRSERAVSVLAEHGYSIVQVPQIQDGESLVDYHGRLEVRLGGVRFQAYTKAREVLAAAAAAEEDQ